VLNEVKASYKGHCYFLCTYTSRAVFLQAGISVHVTTGVTKKREDTDQKKFGSSSKSTRIFTLVAEIATLPRRVCKSSRFTAFTYP
jgi:hypothetical protein